MKKYIILPFICISFLIFPSCNNIRSIFEKKQTDEVPRQSAVLPQDREAIQEQANLKTYESSELKAGIIKGDWAIEQVYDKKAVGEKTPYLKFVMNEKRVFGNNGCNTINATYEFNPADSTLYFDNFITTMIYCGKPDITDIDINTAIANTRYYSWEQDNNSDYYLYFFDENHAPLMTLMHQNFDFLNGAWRVMDINQEPVDIDNMKLVFDVDEHKIHGNTGCNVLNGDFLTDLDTPNTISFEAIAVTLMMCPKMEYQTALLVALEEVEKAKPVNKDKVLLLDSNDNVVLTLIRTEE